MNKIIRKLENEFGKPSTLRKKNKGISEKLNIDIGIVSHCCNLNCRGCNHFSPLIDKEFISLKEYECDIKKLAEIMYSEISQINILGGEPLLHPQIDKFIHITRRYFKIQKICIITNGLLLIKQSEDFWKQCKEANVSIKITRYPINYDYKKLIRLGKERNTDVSFYGRSRFVEKTLFKLPLDKYGKQDAKISFQNCYMGGGMLNFVSWKNFSLQLCSIY